MANSARLRPRLFLEGYEVPCQGISISGGNGTPVTAQIQCVPLPSIKQMLPRSLVHIVVNDPYASAKDYNWYLAFEGEYYGKGFNKAGDSRSFVAQAIDFSSYFDSAKAFFFNPQFASNLGSNLGTQNQPALGADSALTLNAAGKQEQVIPVPASAFDWVAQQMKQVLADPTKDLVDAVTAIFQKLSIGNAFLRLAESRLRITDRIVSQKVGGGIRALLNVEASLAAVSVIQGQAEGGEQSLRDLLNSVLEFIFHDIVYMPFPSKVQANIQQGLVANKQQYTIAETIIKPNIYFVPPPKCNVIFPSMYSNFSFSRNFFAEPTRMTYRPSVSVPGSGDVIQNFVYFPPALSNFMTGKPVQNGTGRYDVASLYGTDYQSKISSQNFGGTDNQGVTDPSITSSLRQNDFLTNEEAIIGIQKVDLSIFPGVNNILQNIPVKEDRDQYFQKICTYLFFKQKFEPRKIQVAVAFNPHVAPGFPVLFLDSSEADQNVIGYLETVEHTINPGSAQTMLTVSYAREVDEVFSSDGQIFEPPIPPWFDSNIWGTSDQAATNTETQSMLAANEITADQATTRTSALNSFQDLSPIYQNLLGVNSTTYHGQTVRTTLDGLTSHLIKVYNSAAQGGDKAEFQFVSNFIRRPLVTMEEAFYFIDATLAANPAHSSNPNTPVANQDLFSEDVYLVFGGGVNGARKALRFTGNLTTAQWETFNGTGFGYLSDQSVITKKRAIIKNYINDLKMSKGQRG